MKRYSLLLLGGLGVMACEAPCGEGQVGDNGLCYQELSAPLERNVVAMRSADLNGDGLSDLALLMRDGQPTLKLLLNSPSGELIPQVIALASSPSALATGDIDADGDQDLLVSLSNSITIFTNDGAANFQAQPSIGTEEAVVDMVVADLNQDLIPDIAIAASSAILFSDSGSIQLLLQSEGSFIPATPLPLTETPFQLRLLDLDQDGDLDIEANTVGFLSFSLIHVDNLGSGLLDSPLEINSETILDDSVESISEDLDNDGAPDTFSVREDFDIFAVKESPIEVQTSLSSGRSSSFKLQRSRQNDSFIQELALSDLDGDDDLDSMIVLEVFEPTDTTLSRLFLAENVNEGRFRETAEILLPIEVGQTLAVDLNLDGHAEIVLLDENGSLFLLSSVR